MRAVDGNVYKGKVDLLIGGTPCQDISVAKANRQGLKGSKSSLFYEYVRIMHECEPKYFLLENNYSMSDEVKDEITRCMGGFNPFVSIVTL